MTILRNQSGAVLGETGEIKRKTIQKKSGGIMEGEDEIERMRKRLEQEGLLRDIRHAVADMQGQLKERSRLCRDRCAKLEKLHQRIEEEIISGQRGLFDVGVMMAPDVERLIAQPSIE